MLYLPHFSQLYFEAIEIMMVILFQPNTLKKKMLNSVITFYVIVKIHWILKFANNIIAKFHDTTTTKISTGYYNRIIETELLIKLYVPYENVSPLIETFDVSK